MQKEQNSSQICPFNDEILLDYINGIASTEQIVAIEKSPACLKAVVVLQDQLAFLQPHLRALFCPSSETLIAYQEKKLVDRAIARHVDSCTYCQKELELLVQVDRKYSGQVASSPASTPANRLNDLARKVYQLIFQPATMSPVPVLGEGSYRTIERSPQIELFIRTTPIPRKQGNWTLFGRVRNEKEQTLLQVDSIILQEIEDELAPEFETTVDEQGTFTLKGLEAGIYRLRIIMADEELVLPQFKVGENQ